MWMINNGILYTSNNGYDKLKNPTIPFSEFLEDCYGVGTFVEFNKLVKDMIEKEINLFPKHMKDLALNDIKNAKRAFLENVRKGTKYNCAHTHCLSAGPATVHSGGCGGAPQQQLSLLSSCCRHYPPVTPRRRLCQAAATP
jgi:hypothetical protein